jgi:hypothetical protein
LFCKFAGIEKQKISAYLVFRKYCLKTIYSGTNFSSFLDFRLIFSITAQSIFGVKPSAWVRWKATFIEHITKIKKMKKNNNNTFCFLLGVTENGTTQKIYGKLVEHYYLLFPSKPLEGDIFCLENIDF